MITTAGDFLAHTKAGLQLTQDGTELGWIGSEEQWAHYEKLQDIELDTI